MSDDYYAKWLEATKQLQEEKKSHAGTLEALMALQHALGVRARAEGAVPEGAAQAEMAERLEALALERDRLLKETERLGELEQRVTHPKFWTQEMVAPFSETLGAFDDVYGANAPEAPGEVLEQFGAWHRQVEETLGALLSGPFDLAACERLRRVLICQWVYLRWLEISRTAPQA